MAGGDTSRGRGRGRGTSQPSLNPQTSSLPITPPSHVHLPPSSIPSPHPHTPSSIPSPHPHSTSGTPSPYHHLSDTPSPSSHPHMPSASLYSHPQMSTTSPSSHPHMSTAPSSSSHIVPGAADDDGRIWIRLGPKLTFDPPVEPPSRITGIIKSKFEGPWRYWKEVDPLVRDMWFTEFGRIYKWLPTNEHQIRKCFDHKGSGSLKNAMNKVHSGADRGNWIPTLVRDMLDTKWQEPGWVEKSRKNSDNRKSDMGVSLHTGGSILAFEHKKRLRRQSDEPPTAYDLFWRLHTRKGHPDQWISQKLEGIAGEYKRRLDERDSQTTGEGSSHQSDNNIYLDVVGGINKKGRIYGLGAESGTLIPSSSTYDSEHCSASELKTMRTTIVTLTSELQQKEKDVNEMWEKL